MAGEALLSIRDLAVEFRTEDGIVHAVDGITYDVFPGEVLGIVGESGSGKSVSTMALLGLIPQPPGRIASGTAMFKGTDLLKMKKRELRRFRGDEVAMVFQDPMTSLNPVLKVGYQLAEAIKTHYPKEPDDKVKSRVVDLLRLVGVPNPEVRTNQYPHEFSGGMRQRAMIAMSIANSPSLLIADEPTTALDVTIQAQVLDLIDRLRRDHGTAVILITHDLGVVAQFADRVAVMYAGTIVEEGTCEQLFRDPQHPYTWGLLGCIPRIDRPRLASLASIEGSPPAITEMPEGCRFRPRCPHAFERCFDAPALEERRRRGHLDACFLTPEQKQALRPAEVVAETPA
jgi:peptide/nickel transport system ATP-binding protein